MRSRAKSGGGDSAARAIRALERSAILGIRVVRSAHDRWRKTPPAPPAPPVPPAKAEDVSEVEVRDLRAELTRELELLAGADISASRGSGTLADGQS